MYYLELTCTLKFDSEELKQARQWWKDKKFSEEKDETVLLSYALEGMTKPDIQEVLPLTRINDV